MISDQPNGQVTVAARLIIIIFVVVRMIMLITIMMMNMMIIGRRKKNRKGKLQLNQSMCTEQGSNSCMGGSCRCGCLSIIVNIMLIVDLHFMIKNAVAFGGVLTLTIK